MRGKGGDVRFSIEIKAPRERVWEVMWADRTFRDWASLIDDGTHMVGELREGGEVQFISSDSGYGVTSRVLKLVPGAFVSFRQVLDTKEHGRLEREPEWAGGEESYALAEQGGVTTVTVNLDVPVGLEETFRERFPKALQRLRALAEA